MSLEYHSQVSTSITSVEIDAIKVDFCKQWNTTTSRLGNASSPMASISRGLRFIPLLWSVLLVITVITSHLISKFCNSPDFLFTSGFQLVQSTFSELLDLLSLVGIASVVVRYLNLELVTRGLGGEVHSRVSSLRLASLAFGFGSMLGIMFISNFRQPNQQAS